MKIDGAKKYVPQRSNGNSDYRNARAMVVTGVETEDGGRLTGYIVSGKDGMLLDDDAPRIPVVVTLSESAKARAASSTNSDEGDFPYGGKIDGRVKNWLALKNKKSKASGFETKSRAKYFGKRVAIIQNPLYKSKFASATEDNPLEIEAGWLSFIESSVEGKVFLDTPVSVHPYKAGFSNLAVYDVAGTGQPVKAVEATAANIKEWAKFFDKKKEESLEARDGYNEYRRQNEKEPIQSVRPYAGFSLRVVKREESSRKGYRKNGEEYSFTTYYTLLANSPFYEYAKNERGEDNQYITELIDGSFFTEKVKSFAAAAKEAFGDGDDIKVEIVPALLFAANMSKSKNDSAQRTDEDVIGDRFLRDFVQSQREMYIQYQDAEPQERDNSHTLSRMASFVEVFPHSSEEGDGDDRIIFDDNRLRNIMFQVQYNYPKPTHNRILSSEFDGVFANQKNFALYIPEDRIHDTASASPAESVEVPEPPKAKEVDKDGNDGGFDVDDDDIPF